MGKDIMDFIKSPAGVIVIALLLIGFDVGGLGTRLSNMLPSGTPVAPSGSGGGLSGICLNDGATMTIGPMQYMWYPTGDVFEKFARVYINDVDYGEKADGASVEVSPGDTITIYYGSNSSQPVPFTDGFVYTAKQEFKAPCKSDFVSGDPTLDNAAYKLYNITEETSTNLSGTVLCWSHDDETQVTGAAPEDLEWGDDYFVKCRMTGIHKKAFSPYANPALCTEYNVSSYDAVEIADMDENIREPVPAPSFLAVSNTAHRIKCYEFEPIMTSNVYDFKVHIDVADTGTNFAAPSYSNNFSLYLLDQDYFENTLTGKWDIGFEDNENTNQGYNGDSTILYAYAVAGPD